MRDDRSIETRRRVLVVDGDRGLGARAGAELGRAGFDVTIAATLAAARVAAAHAVVDVAVIEPRLADGDGLALVPALIAANPRVKVILTTGFSGAAREQLVQRVTGVLVAATEPRLALGTGKLRRLRPDAMTMPVVLPRSLAEIERDHIRTVYESLGKSQLRASQALGISLSTLRRRLAEMGLIGPHEDAPAE